MKAIEAMGKGWELVPRLIPLMIVAFVFNVISGGILLGVMGVNPDAEKINEVAGSVMMLLIGMMMVWGFLEGGIFSNILAQIKTGQSSLNNLPAAGAKFFLRLLALTLLSGIVVAVILGAGAFVTGLIVSLGNSQNPFFNLIGFIIMALAFIIMTIVSVGLYSSRFVAISQDTGPIAALKQAFGILRHHFWRVIFLFVLIFVVFLATSAIVNLIGVLLGRILEIGVVLGGINLVLTSLVNSAVYLYTSAAIMLMILSLCQAKTETISITTPEDRSEAAENK